MKLQRPALLLMLFCAILAKELATSEPQVLIFHVRGIVTDPIGTPMRGVEVSFHGERVNKTVFTNEAGKYEADLPAGIYTMAAQSRGFITYRRPIFRVSSSATVTFHVVLAIGNIINRDRAADPKMYDGADQYPIPSHEGVPFELYIRYAIRTPKPGLIDYDGNETISQPVFVAYDLFSLRANHVTFDVAHHILEAKGNVVVESEDGSALHADKSSYKFENGQATPVR